MIIMMNKETYRITIEDLLRKTPSFQTVGKAGYHPGLQTMVDFDDMLGRPHKSFKTIHIAGTNGKGSVAHFMAAVLASMGYRTGLYTSPHLVDFRERIKIVEPVTSGAEQDGGVSYVMIPEEDVVSFLSEANSFITCREPSFFEITTAMAFDWFRKSEVDIAVIECGLGGRLDSTNVIVPELSIITTIDFDHKDILGDTIEKIAFEKAGIIKKGVPVILGRMPDEARDVIVNVAGECGSDWYYSPDYAGRFSSIPGRAIGQVDVSEMDLQCSVQNLNLQTVAKAVDVLAEKGVVGYEAGSVPRILDALCHTGVSTGLRGRWETLCDRPRIICDIGHNENALTPVMAQLKKTCDELNPSTLYLIFGMAGDKDISSIVHLLPRNARYIFTNARGSRAMPASDLQRLVTSKWRGGRCDIITESVDEAVEKFFEIAEPDDMLYVGGSSYVVAEAIPLIMSKL